ncbi:hypothetical protein SAMN02910377_00187 [Pseudobutyrivibrio ruminis]|uniref:Uncharacterized protein n=1 Tax=Pseudobutyrivibrio ruminis TaxID=46206 RepID=A0A1H7EXI3_9FIRM|nr:hypothetical protein [Pseudobutyrivibrio ruminis]SEK18571.1 hypothetical protein SAMN02910377_00187 [Pseudobutyrivibrio ruminis]
MKIKKYGELIPQTTSEIVNKYGSLQEAALEEPYLYSDMYCTDNPDSPFYDPENGYDVEYIKDCIDGVDGFLKELCEQYDNLAKKIELLDDDIMNLSDSYYEEYTALRDSIGRLLIQKDLLLQELRETHDALLMAEDNISELYQMASTFSEDNFSD